MYPLAIPPKSNWMPLRRRNTVPAWARRETCRQPVRAHASLGASGGGGAPDRWNLRCSLVTCPKVGSKAPFVSRASRNALWTKCAHSCETGTGSRHACSSMRRVSESSRWLERMRSRAAMRSNAARKATAGLTPLGT